MYSRGDPSRGRAQALSRSLRLQREKREEKSFLFFLLLFCRLLSNNAEKKNSSKSHFQHPPRLFAKSMSTKGGSIYPFPFSRDAFSDQPDRSGGFFSFIEAKQHRKSARQKSGGNRKLPSPIPMLMIAGSVSVHFSPPPPPPPPQCHTSNGRSGRGGKIISAPFSLRPMWLHLHFSSSCAIQ